MALASQLDAIRIEQLYLPYDVQTAPLTGEPRFVEGGDLVVSAGGVLRVRGGFSPVEGGTLPGSRKIVRLFPMETMDNPPQVSVYASVLNTVSGLYEFWKFKAGAGWTQLTNLRGLQQSLRPHTAASVRGRMYVKSFPAGSVDKLGTVVVSDDAQNTLDFWGIEPPSEPAHVPNPSNWTQVTTSLPYSTRFGWMYTYAWVTRDGHVSCRAPIERNPSKLPSGFGAVTNMTKCPEVIVRGHPDTARVPWIHVYRTMDGGGTFYYVGRVQNTGDQDITFVDRWRPSGSNGQTFIDPVADEQLDTSRVAPSLVSNYPPPSVAPPKVMFVDAVEDSTPLAYYAGRLWYAIGTYLYFSGQEEITEGLPEHSFPAGVTGNYFRLTHPVVGMTVVEGGMLVHTVEDTYLLSGSDRETFYLRPVLSGIGMRRNSTSEPVGQSAVWISQDGRVQQYRGGESVTISEPIGPVIRSKLGEAERVEIQSFRNDEFDWVIVGMHGVKGVLFIFDVGLSTKTRQRFWQLPWTVPNASAMCVARLSNTDAVRRLLVAFGGQLRVYDEGLVMEGGSPIVGWFRTSLVAPPAGNHMNTYAVATRTVVAHQFEMEYVGNVDLVEAVTDGTWEGAKLLTKGHVPARRPRSVGFESMFWPINVACHRYAAGARMTAPTSVYSMTFVFNATGGA